MSIAFALFAPAAPVSTGTLAAASGVEANDIGLFSGKVADALDAGLGEASTEKVAPLGRLTTARPFGLMLTQAVNEDAAVPSPAVEAASPSAPETVEAALPSRPETVEVKTPPVIADEPVVADDVAKTDSAAAPTATFAPAPTPQPKPLVIPSASSTSQPPVTENSATQPVLDAAITVATPAASQRDAPVEQGLASPSPAAPSASPTSQVSEDFASRVISPPTNASTKLDAKDAAVIVLPKTLDIPVEAKAAPPTLTATSVSAAAPTAPEDAKLPQPFPAFPPQQSSSEVASNPLVRPTTKSEARPVDRTNIAPPEAEKAAVQSTQLDTVKAVQTAPFDAAKAAAAPIAQVMTAAQIPTAQVQVAVTAQMPKPTTFVTADVAAVVVAAELSVEADQVASDQPADAAPADKPAQAPSAMPQTAPPIRAARHELAQQTSNAATIPVQTETTNVTGAPLAKADAPAAQTTAQPVKTAEVIVASPSPLVSATPEAQAANPVAADAQPVQQAVAPGRDLGLSTLSRATVETTAQLAAQMARKLDGRSTRFDMVLTPEDLGRVDVSLEIDKDGQLSARLAFDNPAAAADLRGRADELRRQLQDAGFQVAGDALDFSQRDPSAGGGAFERQQQRNALFAGGSRLAAQADTPIVPAPGAWINHSQTPDRVDLKV
jgi:hypothetical protein